MHDYFYHNLGQTLTLTAADGSDLNLQPTEELAFAGAHLYAYSYLYDKKVAATNKDVKATFTIDMKDKDGDDIYMNLWMKGEPDREVFTALAPMTEGLSRTPNMPYNIKEQPTLTFVARQHGEAGIVLLSRYMNRVRKRNRLLFSLFLILMQKEQVWKILPESV